MNSGRRKGSCSRNTAESRQVCAGDVHLEIDHIARGLTFRKPGVELVARDGEDLDLLVIDAATFGNLLHIASQIEVDGLRAEARGGRTDADEVECFGVITRLFLQLAGRGIVVFLFGQVMFVPNEPGWQLDGMPTDRRAELTDQDEFSFFGEGDDRCRTVATRPLDIFPATVLDESEEFSIVFDFHASTRVGAIGFGKCGLS